VRRAWLFSGLKCTGAWVLLSTLPLALALRVSVQGLQVTLLTNLAVRSQLPLLFLVLLALLAMLGTGELALWREALVLLAWASGLLLSVLALLLLLLRIWVLGCTVLALLRCLAVAHAARGRAAGLFWGAVLRHISY